MGHSSLGRSGVDGGWWWWQGVITTERLSRVRLCGLMDHNPLGSSEHGVLQARILDWVAMPCSRGSSDPGIEPVSFMSPALVGGFFTSSATWVHT